MKNKHQTVKNKFNHFPPMIYLTYIKIISQWSLNLYYFSISFMKIYVKSQT